MSSIRNAVRVRAGGALRGQIVAAFVAVEFSGHPETALPKAREDI
jgi:hypothetical protein